MLSDTKINNFKEWKQKEKRTERFPEYLKFEHNCIDNKGYWVGRVELGFFIWRKHSDAGKANQISQKH